MLHNTVIYCYFCNSLCPWQQLLGNQLARQEKLYTGSVFLGMSRLTIAHTVNIPERRAREEEWDEERGDKGRGGGGVSKRPLGKYWSGEWILCPASGLCEAIGPSDTPFIMPSIDSISRPLRAPSANTHTHKHAHCRTQLPPLPFWGVIGNEAPSSGLRITLLGAKGRVSPLRLTARCL